MDRMACVDVRNLPLQVLLRKNPAWKDLPVAVVDRDRSNGTILYINKRGRAHRIFSGMRYGTGLSLCRDLRGGVVSPRDIDEATDFIAQQLWRFSPRVEPSSQEPGIFWLDVSGLRHIFASPKVWADSIRAALRDAGFHAVTAVGFTRFGSYTAARSKHGSIVFENAEEEYDKLHGTPLEYLNIDPVHRDLFLKLGIDTVGEFARLPRAEIRKRFNADVEIVHSMACEARWHPLQAHQFRETVARTVTLEYPEANTERLLFLITGLLDPILTELSRRHEALKAFHFTFSLNNRSEQLSNLSPASPTLDRRQILLLIRLHLEKLTLTAGVEEVTLRATGERVSQQQLELFRAASVRNLEHANQAIAKLHAFLDQDAIVQARVQDGHLPEAQYRWETVRQIQAPQPAAAKIQGLVKRTFSPPIALSAPSRHEPDGWLVMGLVDGPVDESRGHFTVSGGWWVQAEAARAYYYARTRSGRWLWIYHDLKRRRWFLHGELQ